MIKRTGKEKLSGAAFMLIGSTLLMSMVTAAALTL
jgi:hypothetical protein